MANGVYVCAICGKSHNGIKSRIACETKCLKEREDEEAKKALEAKRKQAEEWKKKKIESEKSIEVELEKLEKMMRKHCREFGDCNFSQDYPYLHAMFGPKLWWF